MYMAKYLSQPTHPSLSPGSGPMPDFCVGKHTVGGWFRDGRWTSGSLSHILQLARGTKSVKITDWLINQNHPKSPEGQEQLPSLLKPEKGLTGGGCYAWGDIRAHSQNGGDGPHVCVWVGWILT